MLNKIKGNLIVSCQALEDEPLHSPFIMGRMAKSALQGGAVAIRAQGVEDIIEIKKVTNLPVIGIIKKNYPDSDIYITPTKTEVELLLSTKCEMIALDATKRTRPNNENFNDLVQLIKKNNVLVMADISTFDEALQAQKAGVDCISTTLAGYTPYSNKYNGPDLKLIQKLTTTLNIPIIAEGRINTPQDLKNVYNYDIWSAVVGSAITRPQLITEKFYSIIKNK